MLRWTHQGGVWLATLRLTKTQSCKIAIVGPRDNPRGAMVLLPGEGGSVKKQSLADFADQLTPKRYIEILCMQERIFGDSGLPTPPTA